MRKMLVKLLVPLAAVGLAVGPAAIASAQSGSQAFQAMLQPVPLNGQTSASGTLMLTLNGSQATITEHVSGLAATFMGQPYPHVQHIHGGAQGVCPTAAADANHDGVISTADGQPSYGAIQTTLSVSGDTTPASGTNLKIAPSGASINYQRTITLDAATLTSIQKGIAVVVVHGLDPATAPKGATTEKSELVPSLPLAATSPALCGTLVAAPSGGASTGAGGTAGTQDAGLYALGGAALLAAGGVFAARRRIGQHS